MKIMKNLERAAYLLLVLSAGIFCVLVWWVMLAINLRMMFQEWRVRHTPVRTINEMLTAAGLTIQANAPTDETPVTARSLPLAMSEVRALLASAGL
jgi:hypothetical protein